jgi:uncharacterized protein DUF402
MACTEDGFALGYSDGTGTGVAGTPPDDAHSLWLMWTESWQFKCWYVQLQSPIVWKRRAIETMDQALDVALERRGRVRRSAAVARFHSRTGERVISQRLWISGWEHWRPS